MAAEIKGRCVWERRSGTAYLLNQQRDFDFSCKVMKRKMPRTDVREDV